MIAALFVDAGGPYFGLPHVDPWPADRDARGYAGPWPIVAHPPCGTWSHMKAFAKATDDGGCFAAALAALRRFGGVVEHPAGSGAWCAFGLMTPPNGGGWVWADWRGLWTCCVRQGAYGHLAEKRTWLLVHGTAPPPLRWGSGGAGRYVELLSAQQRRRTPLPFRDLLLSIAAECRP